MKPRNLITQFVTYAGVGSVGTLVHYLMLLLLVEGLDMAPYQGAVAGFLSGALINYGLNHRITFRSSRKHGDALPKFLSVAAIGALLTGALMAWATERLKIHYFIAQLITTALLLVFTFAVNRLWTFRHIERR